MLPDAIQAREPSYLSYGPLVFGSLNNKYTTIHSGLSGVACASSQTQTESKSAITSFTHEKNQQ